ncbi:hypothetical protein RDI58_024245 [Solanum bulbocastanum]|uniref:Transposase MuDR plant domain-containing protein n=1 Tax=Solanum bulbocastanum TaxID=147425 RepID=A0AAN8SX66_SOLBU
MYYDLVYGDELHVYVVHEIDDLEELPALTGLLPWSGPIDEFVGINTEGTVENDLDLNGVDTELPGDEDDSDIDEELRSLRAERRNKRNPNLKKKKTTEEVPIGEAGVDRGFEDIGINKKDRYVGRLGGDEKYIDSSECDSDDSTDMLDTEAAGGVDLPGRRKSKKVRYDDKCTIAIFELGMIFENAKEFRKALAKYAAEKHYQIKLRPNEAPRVRAKCKFKEKCKWLCYGAIDRDSVIKQTNPGSSIWVRMDRETVPRKNLFVYFYVCLDALKKGWKEGCRRIIEFDGCFLKGACKGELFVAVGRNGNNQIFPIAWAVVDKETKHSWSFFINYLKEDLQLGTG